MSNGVNTAQKRVLLTSETLADLHPLATIVHDARNKLMPILAGLSERNQMGEEYARILLTLAEGVRDKTQWLMGIAKRCQQPHVGFNRSEYNVLLEREFLFMHGLFSNILSQVDDDENRRYIVPIASMQKAADEFDQLLLKAVRMLREEPYEEIPASGNISAYVKDIVEDFERRYPQITFHTDIEPDCHTVFQQTRLNRALENLLNNSIQALPESGGEITVTLKNRSIDSQSRPFDEIQAGDYISIEVSDNGSGIPEELLMKLRHSSVTTKQGGSGIGLASVRKSILRHKGHLYVESEEGCGTRFTTLIPSTPPPPKFPSEPPVSGYPEKDEEK